jgi:hypothetical protein
MPARQLFANLLSDSGYSSGDRVKWLVDSPKVGLNPSWLNASTPNAPGHLYLWTSDVYSCGGKCRASQYLFDLKTGDGGVYTDPAGSEYYLPVRSLPKTNVFIPDQAP